MMVIGRLRPDKKTKYGTKSGRPRAPRRSALEDRTGANFRPGGPSNSLLEQLPTELIQDIFLYSANLHLPLCSKQLLSALTSDHLKYEITLQILVYQRDKLSIADKSVLLTRQFFTWDFLVRYVSFATPRIIVEIEDDDTNQSVDSLEDDEGYAATERSRSVGSSRGGRRTEQPSLRDIDTDLSARTESAVREIRRDEISHLDEMPTQAKDNVNALRRMLSFQGLLDLHLPAKLLHGSWDDDKRRLLRLLISFNGTMSKSSSPDGLTRIGILDAIQQEDEEVVSYLLGAQIGVIPDIDMLREAVKQTNLSVVHQLLRASTGQIDMLDPQVWRLLAEHMTWSSEAKGMVEFWLQNGVARIITEDDVDFLPKLKDISLGTGRWITEEDD